MSGERPDFLLKNHFVLVNGTPLVVRDIYHVGCGPDGRSLPHNSDCLKVDIEGVGDIYFGDKRFDIRPLPAISAPEWLREGVVIDFDSSLFKRTVRTNVENIFGRQARGDKKVDTIVKLKGWTPMEYDPDTMKLVNS